MPSKPSLRKSEAGAETSWKNKILRCLIKTPSPILFPVEAERWNETHAVAMRLRQNDLVLCVVHENGTFQVLHDESVWDTEQKHFAICSTPDDLEEQSDAVQSESA